MHCTSCGAESSEVVRKQEEEAAPGTACNPVSADRAFFGNCARSIARIFGWSKARITRATDACPRVTEVLNTWIQNMPKSVATENVLLFCNAYPPRVCLALPSSTKVCPKAFQHGARAEDRALLRCEQHVHAAVRHSQGNGGTDHSEGGDRVVLGRSDTLLFPFCFYFLLGGEPHPARRATETEALRKASLARPADCPAAV